VIATVSGGTSTFIDPSACAGANYSYRISAVGSDGPSVPSAEASAGSGNAPAITSSSVVNGASFSATQQVAPGSMVSLFGRNLGVRAGAAGLEPFTEEAGTPQLPGSLGGYSVLFNGIAAPMRFVTGSGNSTSGFSGQINAQVPWEVQPGPVTVVVRNQSSQAALESAPVQITAAQVSPALFTLDSGVGRVLAVNVKSDPASDVVNGSIAQPENSIPGLPTQPAKVGGAVILYANGLGPVTPAGSTGEPGGSQLHNVVNRVRLFIGAVEAQVLFAGLAPEFAGVNQINAVIPEGVAPGDKVAIRIEQAGAVSVPGVTIAIR
jgi:uncharacterized protein (TIGR03437 family)